MSGSRFPEGAEIRFGRCNGLCQSDGVDVAVARLRIGRGPNLEYGMFLCVECLADFAVAGISGASVWVRAIDGEFHEVEGRLRP